MCRNGYLSDQGTRRGALAATATGTCGNVASYTSYLKKKKKKKHRRSIVDAKPVFVPDDTCIPPTFRILHTHARDNKTILLLSHDPRTTHIYTRTTVKS
ncbi:Uncharacterized protein FWK35_00032468 [Aphis craccivora]|uniref:Uncharacterized protein n=1 Tax=Aphis craccivora TaxID=307492 RepID=A0A6G0ZBS6_APHCR|nr:Uncharacterized protein FWK35_00032468 [Aphis craccivora]